MLNWVLIIVFTSSAFGSSMTSIRVSSKESCENIAKNLPHRPHQFGDNYIYSCIEDKP